MKEHKKYKITEHAEDIIEGGENTPRPYRDLTKDEREFLDHYAKATFVKPVGIRFFLIF